MRCDRDDRQHRDPLAALQRVGPVIKEDTVRAGRLLLYVGLVDFLAVRADERMEAMSLQRWVAQVCFEQTECLPDLFQKARFRAAVLELLQVSSGFRGESKLTIHRQRIWRTIRHE